MTKKEFEAAMTALEQYNRNQCGAAAEEVRLLYKSAIQTLYKTGAWDEGVINQKILEVFTAAKYAAADKLQALQLKYYSAALVKGGYKQRLDLPTVFFTASGKVLNLETFIKPIAHNYQLADSVWGTAEVKARALAAVDFSRAVGWDEQETRSALDILCSPQGGKKLAKKITRLYRVKDDEGNVVQKRWEEGWKRDWLEDYNETHKTNVEYGSAEFKKLFKDEGGQTWIDRHSVGTSGRKLLPQVHRDFVKRLGTGKVDYRVERLIKTEASQAFNARMEEMGSGELASGRFLWILAPHRDAEKCECQEIAEWSKNDGNGRTYTELQEKTGKQEPAPLHPNCMCWLKPVALTVDEIVARAKRLME